MLSGIFFNSRRLKNTVILETLFRKISMQTFCEDSRKIFKAAYTAVQPRNLIPTAVKVHPDYVDVQGKQFPLAHNVYIVGFGKGVLGMAAALEELLEEHIVSGILSVPEGIQALHNSNHGKQKHKLKSCIQIFEGAANNIPDEKSLFAASKISELVVSLNHSHLLFVLITGGGSALLPAPKPPLTLSEKQKVIKLLASKGATIEEMNAVRKRLSLLKGGGLAEIAKPATVVSLILSDIIGDPLDFIASAPTVKNTDDPTLPMNIIVKYNLTNDLPPSAIQLLQQIPDEVKLGSTKCFDHVNNYIIGNNMIALKAAFLEAEEMQYTPFIITNSLQGTARTIGEKLIICMEAALQQNTDTVFKICNEIELQPELVLDATAQLKNSKKGICLLFGGETTVKVHGKGVGGRNQELALAAALQLYYKQFKYRITLLSAGTDGIDGPTPAAGAIATKDVIATANKEETDAIQFLNENNSYTFFSQVGKGQWLIKSGHTGTNVMDIIIILISRIRNC
ncbi:glycerate kinase-like [Stegodyphus dumicola]|uniref:glycerate kinase-like n=1 Tax=Stegodyphus dumicola TaxID=202533 RepID=UPI0015AB04F2|nr:glycerate kinase-like [Stegodyphus dumicola]